MLFKQSKQYSLVQEELNDFIGVSNNRKFKDRIANKLYRMFMYDRDIKYSLIVSKSDYLHGELLCADITEEYGELFTLVDLINILFHDFLKNVRRLADHNRIYTELKIRDKSNHSIQIINGAEEETILNDISGDTLEIEFVIKRTEALRLEVFLADLAELYPDNPYSVEDVLKIMYCDFIDAYKKGEMKNIVTRIIESL